MLTYSRAITDYMIILLDIEVSIGGAVIHRLHIVVSFIKSLPFTLPLSSLKILVIIKEYPFNHRQIEHVLL
jgi:hypothetical protein